MVCVLSAWLKLVAFQSVILHADACKNSIWTVWMNHMCIERVNILHLLSNFIYLNLYNAVWHYLHGFSCAKDLVQKVVE